MSGHYLTYTVRPPLILMGTSDVYPDTRLVNDRNEFYMETDDAIPKMGFNSKHVWFIWFVWFVWF